MSFYAISFLNSKEISQKVLDTRSGIILLNALNNPPHIIYFSYGRIYQSSIRLNKELNLKTIERLKIPLIAFVLDLKEETKIEERVDYHTSQHTKVTIEKTCFYPIAKSFKEVLGLDFLHTYDLIVYFYSIMKIHSVYQLNLDKQIAKGKNVLILKKYNKKDIAKSLEI